MIKHSIRGNIKKRREVSRKRQHGAEQIHNFKLSVKHRNKQKIKESGTHLIG